MTYQFHIQEDPKKIDEFVIQSEQNSLFQCSDWAEIKNNWDHLMTSVTLDGKIVGTALVLIRKMPLGTTLFYVPRGPVMDYENKALVYFYLDSLVAEAKKRHSIALRFDPAILSKKYAYEKRSEETQRENEDVIALLKEYGAVHKGYTTMIDESTQPRYNASTDVRADYKDALIHKTLKRMSMAEYKGIELFEGHEYSHDFAVAMHYTEIRKQVALRNEEYFNHMLSVYGEHAICMVTKLNIPEQLKKLRAIIDENQKQLDSGELSRKKTMLIKEQLQNDCTELEKLEADQKREEHDVVITSGVLAVYNQNLMEILYMGNNTDYLRMFSSYLLYAKCIDKCVELGIKRCSFGGVEGTLNDGLTIFKANWLMNVEEYIGEFNIILNKPMYKAFDEIYPHLLKTVAKLRGKH